MKRTPSPPSCPVLPSRGPSTVTGCVCICVADITSSLSMNTALADYDTVPSMNAMSNEKRRYELKARAESQRQTRERIVQATMELHEEVGPAQTTIAEIARRAHVQRLTVYN